MGWIPKRTPLILRGCVFVKILALARSSAICCAIGAGLTHSSTKKKVANAEAKKMMEKMVDQLQNGFKY